jgi:hypothetical protein
VVLATVASIVGAARLARRAGGERGAAGHRARGSVRGGEPARPPEDWVREPAGVLRNCVLLAYAGTMFSMFEAGVRAGLVVE